MNVDMFSQDSKKVRVIILKGILDILILTNNETFLLKITQAVKDNIATQITKASQMIKLEIDPHAAFALIIDGKTLTYALEDDIKHQFLNLAVDCASVICCRVSPKQKAMVNFFRSLCYTVQDMT